MFYLQQKEEEVNNLKNETQKLNKLREGIQRKLRNVEEQKLDIDQQKETLKSQIIGLERSKLQHTKVYIIKNIGKIYILIICEN